MFNLGDYVFWILWKKIRSWTCKSGVCQWLIANLSWSLGLHIGSTTVIHYQSSWHQDGGKRSMVISLQFYKFSDNNMDKLQELDHGFSSDGLIFLCFFRLFLFWRKCNWMSSSQIQEMQIVLVFLSLRLVVTFFMLVMWWRYWSCCVNSHFFPYAAYTYLENFFLIFFKDLSIAYGFNKIPETIPATRTEGKRQPLNLFSDLIRLQVLPLLSKYLCFRFLAM